MGMYSYFRFQEIKIINKEGLIESMEGVEDQEWREFVSKEGEVEFDNYDSWKIYGYFYPEMCSVLSRAAEFIEGFAEFMYEEGMVFRLVFKDKKWFLQETELKWLEPKEIHK